MKVSNQALQATGIPSLDESLHGGIPVGSTILLAGTAGTGKTVLSQQWLFKGYTELGEKGIYIAVTEPINKALQHASEFSFFDQKVVDSLGIYYSDFRAILQSLKLDQEDRFIDEIDQVVEVIKNLLVSSGSKRMVIDSITSLFHHIQDMGRVRIFVFDFMFKLSQVASELGATIVFTSEVHDHSMSSFGLEEFIADGIIELRRKPGEQSIVRTLQIIKMRGAEFADSPMTYKIDRNGVLLFPKIQIPNEVMETSFDKRRKTGVAALDRMVEGGYPEGHMVLVGGNTGSGKTTLAMQFLVQGIKEGENAVYVTLEEPVAQVKKTAAAHGWDLDRWEKEGKLKFVPLNLIDTYLDEALYSIVEAVKKLDATRVVIDSISALESASTNRDKVREFMIQLTHFLKSRGANCVMSYLVTDTFGAVKGQLLGATASSQMRLSSNVDGIVMLRYVEQGRSVKRLLNVLKMRGSDHDKSIKEFKIRTGGVQVERKFRR